MDNYEVQIAKQKEIDKKIDSSQTMSNPLVKEINKQPELINNEEFIDTTIKNLDKIKAPELDANKVKLLNGQDDPNTVLYKDLYASMVADYDKQITRCADDMRGTQRLLAPVSEALDMLTQQLNKTSNQSDKDEIRVKIANLQVEIMHYGDIFRNAVMKKQQLETQKESLATKEALFNQAPTVIAEIESLKKLDFSNNRDRMLMLSKMLSLDDFMKQFDVAFKGENVASESNPPEWYRSLKELANKCRIAKEENADEVEKITQHYYDRDNDEYKTVELFNDYDKMREILTGSNIEEIVQTITKYYSYLALDPDAHLNRRKAEISHLIDDVFTRHLYLDDKRAIIVNEIKRQRDAAYLKLDEDAKQIRTQIEKDVPKEHADYISYYLASQSVTGFAISGMNHILSAKLQPFYKGSGLKYKKDFQAFEKSTAIPSYIEKGRSSFTNKGNADSIVTERRAWRFQHALPDSEFDKYDEAHRYVTSSAADLRDAFAAHLNNFANSELCDEKLSMLLDTYSRLLNHENYDRVCTTVKNFNGMDYDQLLERATTLETTLTTFYNKKRKKIDKNETTAMSFYGLFNTTLRHIQALKDFAGWQDKMETYVKKEQYDTKRHPFMEEMNALCGNSTEISLIVKKLPNNGLFQPVTNSITQYTKVSETRQYVIRDIDDRFNPYQEYKSAMTSITTCRKRLKGTAQEAENIKLLNRLIALLIRQEAFVSAYAAKISFNVNPNYDFSIQDYKDK